MPHQTVQYQAKKPVVQPLMALLFITFVLISPSGNAEVYKWVDEQGNTHFGDRPPQKEKATDLSGTLKPLNISTDLSNPNMIRNAEQARQDELNQKAQTQHKQAASQSEQKQQYCKQAKKRLYDISGPVVFYDDEGKVVEVTEKERARMEQKLRAEIDKNCK